MGHRKGKEIHACPLTGIPKLGDLAGGCLLQSTRGITLPIWCPRGDNRHIHTQGPCSVPRGEQKIRRSSNLPLCSEELDVLVIDGMSDVPQGQESAQGVDQQLVPL